jgi:hypothetical protein
VPNCVVFPQRLIYRNSFSHYTFVFCFTVCMYLQILRQSKIKLRYWAKFRLKKFSQNSREVDAKQFRDFAHLICFAKWYETKLCLFFCFAERCKTKFRNVFCFATHEKFREILSISHLFVISRNKMWCEKWKP